MDSRQKALIDWLREQMPSVEPALEPASTDASFRRYFRIRAPDGGTRIVMDSPPEKEDPSPFIAVTRRLEAAGVRVPSILAADTRRGFLLLSDLGHETYLEAFGHREPAPMMSAAVDALVRMQAKADCQGLPDYDRALLMRELRLFPDWYLAREQGVKPDRASRVQLENWFECLCDRALDQATVFVHRDYMPRNLMASDPLPGVIDYQDAVRGPVSYDPVCLFMDAFYSFSPDTVTAGLRDYHDRALNAGVPVPKDHERFLSDAVWMGVQRHLKVIGIFARIAHRDGKPHYLRDVPRFFGYLRRAAEAEPELAGLYGLIRHWAPATTEGAN
jgi:aminoglycoside/choline kinase family phosphotransferase